MSCGWEGDCRFGITAALHHKIGLHCLREGSEHSIYAHIPTLCFYLYTYQLIQVNPGNGSYNALCVSVLKLLSLRQLSVIALQHAFVCLTVCRRSIQFPVKLTATMQYHDWRCWRCIFLDCGFCGVQVHTQQPSCLMNWRFAICSHCHATYCDLCAVMWPVGQWCA